jgi:DDE domain
MGQVHTVNPRTITVDKNPAYPRAVTDMKTAGEICRFSRLRQVKFLNNIVEQDHRRIKRLVRPGLGFGNLRTARRTLAGFEAMATIRNGQVRNIGGQDIEAQTAFIAGLFKTAACSEPTHRAHSTCSQTLQKSPSAIAKRMMGSSSTTSIRAGSSCPAVSPPD